MVKQSQQENNQTVNSAIGDRIRMAREAKGLSQKDIADRTLCTVVTVNRYERGHRTPDADFLNQLVTILGCDPGWLLTGKEPETRKLETELSEDAFKVGETLQIWAGRREGKSRPILLLEEPEAHLHPEVVVSLINMLLDDMTDDQRKDILKYAKERKLLAELAVEHKKKKGGRR